MVSAFLLCKNAVDFKLTSNQKNFPRKHIKLNFISLHCPFTTKVSNIKNKKYGNIGRCHFGQTYSPDR